MSTIALISIARPTFDVPLAQSVADNALALLEKAGQTIIATRNELLMDESGSQRAISALAAQEYDLLILLQASFADSSMAAQIAEANRASAAPVLLWAVPDAREGSRLRLNSLCGINLAGHALTQKQLAYQYLLSPTSKHESNQQSLAKIDALARAGKARRVLQSARLGLVGEHPDGFDTCAYSEDDLRQLFGTKVVPLRLNATLQGARDADDAARDSFIAKAAEHVSNLDKLDEAATRGTAGIYAMLRGEAERQNLDGIAVRCWPEFFTELGCAACGAMSMLCHEGTPASCEADINGTLTLVLMQAISGEQAFITDLVSVEEESDTGVLWHCGLAPFSMADPDGEIVGTLHSNRKLPLLFEFTLKPGRVTIARLNRTMQPDGSNSYRLIIGGGEMVQAPMSFGGTSGVVRFDRPALDVFDTVMREGLEHHFCITYGNHQEALHAFANTIGLPTLNLT